MWASVTCHTTLRSRYYACKWHHPTEHFFHIYHSAVQFMFTILDFDPPFLSPVSEPFEHIMFSILFWVVEPWRIDQNNIPSARYFWYNGRNFLDSLRERMHPTRSWDPVGVSICRIMNELCNSSILERHDRRTPTWLIPEPVRPMTLKNKQELIMALSNEEKIHTRCVSRWVRSMLMSLWCS